MIKSLYDNQKELINSIVSLHCGGSLDADITYSSGKMYKGCSFQGPSLKFDISPTAEDVIEADASTVKFDSVDSIMFDPPFLATTGKSLKKQDGNNLIAQRFSVFPNERSLHQFYIDVMENCYDNLLNDNGILIFKCQDKVSSGKQYFSHCFIHDQAVKLGFYPLDLFVLLSKTRMTPKWQVDNQKHARKFHSYFWVFKKCKKQVSY